jgi:hypothetical protein
VEAHRDGRQKGHSSAEENGEEVKRNGAKDDGLSADKSQALQSLMEAAPRGRYPVLEHVVDLVITDRVELAST